MSNIFKESNTAIIPFDRPININDILKRLTTESGKINVEKIGSGLVTTDAFNLLENVNTNVQDLINNYTFVESSVDIITNKTIDI